MKVERIKSWLRQPKVWRFVCIVLSIIGMFCFALSSIFNELFGTWRWWKIFLSVVFSSIISLALFFTKAWPPSASLSLEARVGFLLLMVTSLYSFYFDESVKGKPDAYSMASFAAFAVMSVGLSRLIHFGFGVHALCYFCGLLTVQLMKIKFCLFIVGASFSCPLVILCYTPLLNNLDIERPFVEEDVESGSFLSARSSVSQGITTTKGNVISQDDVSLENEDPALLVIQVESDSQDRGDGNSILRQLMDCILELKKENETLIPMVCSHVEKYLKATVDSEQTKVYPDVNLLKDALPSATIRRLQRTVKLMVAAGSSRECCYAYSDWRRQFIENCLTSLGLQLEELHVGKWIKTCKAAANVLFPMERVLCDHVFSGFSQAADVSSTQLCTNATELTIRLLNFMNIIVTSGSYLRNHFFSSSRIPKMSESLRQLRRLCELFGYSEVGSLLRYEADRVLERLDNFIELDNIIYRNTAEVTVSGGGLHPITQKVMNYIPRLTADFRTRQFIRKRKSLVSVQIARMIELLESNLEAMSRDYNSALGYVFMMNNLHYIGHETSKLTIRLEEDWFQKNTAKVDQNFQLYLSSSWNQILDFLKLDINDSLSLSWVSDDTVAESMKDKLNLFNLHFEEICNDQSTWIVYDKKLRERIIKSIEKVLLPAYGSFIERFHNVFGNHAYEYIEHGIKDIVDRLGFLFLVDE
ncbi:hypothetical protein Fmac_031307 [Flemingia macrophylla]|uniref:Exocyst subunit Exo70 family protein n=1 Tax=Flemingia macrophylla TaxID=520843 RepID=A0ABD1L1R3_9FABA